MIEKSKNTGEYPGEIRYRIKFINSGSRDLTEVTLLVRLSINWETVSNRRITNYTYLGIGNDSKLPILRGKSIAIKILIVELRPLHYFPHLLL